MRMKVNCNLDGVKEVINKYHQGEVIIFPTDTVYGIGCNPYNSKSVKKVFQIKQRVETKPLPILAFSKEEIKKIAKLDGIIEKIADRFWPGPLTVVLENLEDKFPAGIIHDSKIAVRIPGNKCILSILKECKLLVGTSANISGKDTITDSTKIDDSGLYYDIFLDDGKISGGESTIIELKNEKINIIREGNITSKEIFALN